MFSFREHSLNSLSRAQFIHFFLWNVLTEIGMRGAEELDHDILCAYDF